MPTYAQRMLALRVVIGTLWAGFLYIAGLSIAVRSVHEMPGAADALRAGGVGFASLGMYVFSCVVADRLFPRADTRLCTAVEVLFGLVTLGSLVYLAPTAFRLIAAAYGEQAHASPANLPL